MMDILKTLSSALRRGKPTEKQDAPAAATLKNKLLKAITPEARPYRIAVFDASGKLVAKAVTAAEWQAYCNRDSAWHRIA